MPRLQKKVFYRLYNTDLKHFWDHWHLRPVQLSHVSKYLHIPRLAGGILAGDLNAAEPFDRTLLPGNNLHDIYLELGGKEDGKDGIPGDIRFRGG
jgi:tyrosyl-DNA phosphodiesterase 2